MFVGAEELPEKADLDADLLVVGTGPAGLTIAHEFLGAGVKVVVLESGGMEFSSRVQALYRGEVTGAPNFATTFSRFRVYGGSTTRWAGQCVPLEPIDFEARQGVPYSGWPFNRAHLEPFYDRASTLLGVDEAGYTIKPWVQRGGQTPPVANGEIRTSAIAFARPPDLGAVLRQWLSTSRNVTVVLGANALAVETGEDQRGATAVRFATLSGRTGRWKARRIVLACGGIENARLLLASDDRVAGGLGNGRDLVGRYFMDHPYLTTGHLDPAQPDFDAGLHVIEDFSACARDPGGHAAFTLDPDIRRREGLAGCVGYFVRRQAYQLRPSYHSRGGAALTHFAEIARGDRVADTDLARRALDLLLHAPSTAAQLSGWVTSVLNPRPVAALRMVLETTPNRDSRIVLGERRDRLGMRQVRIDWRINPRDWDGLERFRTAFAAAFAAAGAGKIVDDRRTDGNGWPISMTGGKHHMGSTRMHADPGMGVVDPDLRVHGMANLYVAGSSVFPSAGWANPTLTIVALSLRLSDHLRGLK